MSPERLGTDPASHARMGLIIAVVRKSSAKRALSKFMAATAVLAMGACNPGGWLGWGKSSGADEDRPEVARLLIGDVEGSVQLPSWEVFLPQVNNTTNPSWGSWLKRDELPIAVRNRLWDDDNSLARTYTETHYDRWSFNGKEGIKVKLEQMLAANLAHEEPPWKASFLQFARNMFGLQSAALFENVAGANCASVEMREKPFVRFMKEFFILKLAAQRGAAEELFKLDWDGEPLFSFPLPHAPTIREQMAYAETLAQAYISDKDQTWKPEVAAQLIAAGSDAIHLELAYWTLQRERFGARSYEVGSQALLTPYGVAWTVNEMMNITFARHFEDPVTGEVGAYTDDMRKAADRMLEHMNAFFYLNGLNSINSPTADINYLTQGSLLSTFGFPDAQGHTSGGAFFGGRQPRVLRYVGQEGAAWGSAILHLGRWWEQQIKALNVPTLWQKSPEEIETAWRSYAADLMMRIDVNDVKSRVSQRADAHFKKYRQAVIDYCSAKFPSANLEHELSELQTVRSIVERTDELTANSGCASPKIEEVQSLPGLGVIRADGRSDQEVLDAVTANLWEFIGETYTHKLHKPAAAYEQEAKAIAAAASPDEVTILPDEFDLAYLLKLVKPAANSDLSRQISASATDISVGTKTYISLYYVYRALIHESVEYLHEKIKSIHGNKLEMSTPGIYSEGPTTTAEDDVLPRFLAWLRLHRGADNLGYFSEAQQKEMEFYELQVDNARQATNVLTMQLMTDDFDDDLWQQSGYDTIKYVELFLSKHWNITDETAIRFSNWRAHMGYQYASYYLSNVEAARILEQIRARYSDYLVDTFSLLACERVMFREDEEGLALCLPSL